MIMARPAQGPPLPAAPCHGSGHGLLAASDLATLLAGQDRTGDANAILSSVCAAVEHDDDTIEAVRVAHGFLSRLAQAL